jgi:hypothetical protein
MQRTGTFASLHLINLRSDYFSSLPVRRPRVFLPFWIDPFRAKVCISFLQAMISVCMFVQIRRSRPFHSLDMGKSHHRELQVLWWRRLSDNIEQQKFVQIPL